MTSPSTGTPAVATHRSRRTASLLQITRTLAWSEFKLRYAGSVFGYAWSIAKPLMLFGVLYVIFHKMLRFGEGVPRFPEALLLGIVLWTFFAETTMGSVIVLVQRADMLRKVSFPNIALPVAVAATASFALFFNLATVLVMLVALGVTPTWHWLLFPLLAAELFLVTLGVGLILSSMYVTMRDVGQLWDVLVQLLFYATPILYPLSLLSTDTVPVLGVTWAELSMMNPMAQIIEQSRRILVYGESGGIGDLLPGALVAVPYALAAIILIGGLLLFRRASVQMVEAL